MSPEARNETPLQAWRADVRRYERREWLTEPSLWAISVYRFGTWCRTLGAIPRRLTGVLYAPLHLVTMLSTGISIPRSAQIGGGLRIFHFGGIVVHPETCIGSRCTIGHGVTFGVRESEHDAPTLQDDVTVGAGAVILGAVRVGCGAKVGAMSVVIRDVPAGVAVAGNPARVLGAR